MLPFEEVIYPVALGLDFAQRLYQVLSPNGRFDYKFSLSGIKGQRLSSFDSHKFAMDRTNYFAGEEVITSHAACNVSELRSGWRTVAQRIIKDILILFNWDIEATTVDQRLDDLEGKRGRSQPR